MTIRPGRMRRGIAVACAAAVLAVLRIQPMARTPTGGSGK